MNLSDYGNCEVNVADLPHTLSHSLRLGALGCRPELLDNSYQQEPNVMNEHKGMSVRGRSTGNS